MTEEDTFDRLKKASLGEAQGLLIEWYLGNQDSDIDVLLKKIGWTYENLIDELQSSSPGDRHK